MKRVIVTGAGGCIGNFCVPLLLEKRYEVHGFSRNASRESQGVLWHKINLLEESPERLMSQVKPTHLLHLAWVTEHGKFWESSENSRWVDASMALIESFYRNGGHRVVSSGTCAEYEWGSAICIEGETPDVPRTKYGRSKKEFSDRALEFSKETSLSSASGRIFYPYGPGEPITRLLPHVIISLLKGESPACTDCSQVRDFIYMGDVASALVHLLDSEVTGVVNIATGVARKISEVLDQVRIQSKCQQPIHFGALSRGDGDPDFLTASTKRLNDEVGWQPITTLDEGVGLTIDWIRSILGPHT